MGKSDKKQKTGKGKPETGTKRPPVWVVAVILGGVAAAIAGIAQDRTDDFLDPLIPELGDPVTVQFVGFGEQSGHTMAVPPDVSIDEADVAAVNAMSFDERMAWLDDREASRIAPIYLNVVLTGNRNKQVQIMDITPVSECVTPAEAGTLFVDPPAGGGDNILLSFDLDEPKPVAMVEEEVAGEYITRPYFVHHTVSLQEDEQQVFQITLDTELSTCSFFLDFSILDGPDLKTQRLSRDGKPFRVTADLPQPSWQQVYVGGVAACDSAVGFAPATEAWLRGDFGSHCE